jgi:hypothetical protein
LLKEKSIIPLFIILELLLMPLFILIDGFLELVPTTGKVF